MAIVSTATPPAPGPLETQLRSADDVAARTSLRTQIARLERQLGSVVLDLWDAGRVEQPLLPDRAPLRGAPAEARLLSLGELEAVRDALVDQVRAGTRAAMALAVQQGGARGRLQAMLADPPAHRFEIVRLDELGERGCGAYQALPRLGLLGMLFGWWCVKLSSGCP